MSKTKKTNGARMVAHLGEVPNKYLLALDSGAFTTVMCNKAFVNEFKPMKCDPLLTWNGESVANSASGQLHPLSDIVSLMRMLLST